MRDAAAPTILPGDDVLAIGIGVNRRITLKYVGIQIIINLEIVCQWRTVCSVKPCINIAIKITALPCGHELA